MKTEGSKSSIKIEIRKVDKKIMLMQMKKSQLTKLTSNSKKNS